VRSHKAKFGDLVGVIRHRLLINQLVDPAEVAPRLPAGMKPHVSSSGGVVVGCCLLGIEAARPWPTPASMGGTVQAAAHRISAEVTSHDGESTRVVYVPCRHTNGLLPVLTGGRIFPGVHQRADIDVSVSPEQVAWSVQGRRSEMPFDIAAVADRRGASVANSEVADIVLGTVVGLSPGHRSGSIETAELRPANQSAERVELISLQSDFLASFKTAEPADTLLMTDVGVIWRPTNPAGT